jgi:hypothetical protein
MARQSEKPPLSGCKGSLHTPKNGGWISWHWWHYSDNWNGNNRKILPFLTSTRGVRRSGWRCLDCGEFVWDLSDKEFALSCAESIGAIKLPTEPTGDSVNEPESETQAFHWSKRAG